MILLIGKHEVADFDTFKKVYDQYAEVRKEHGWMGGWVARNSEDPNVVYLYMKWESVESAKAYMASDHIEEAMQEADVIGVPEIEFLDIVEEIEP